MIRDSRWEVEGFVACVGGIESDGYEEMFTGFERSVWILEGQKSGVALVAPHVMS